MTEQGTLLWTPVAHARYLPRLHWRWLAHDVLPVAALAAVAALALGMRTPQIFWHIVLPQAMRVIIPPTANQFISMLKDSSLISVMGVWEVMFLAQSYGRSSYRYLEMLTTAAVIYWVLSILLELVQARLERHFGKAYQR